MSERDIDKAIERIADGEKVDWQALDHKTTSESLRRWLTYLRVVDTIADLHRTDAESQSTRNASTAEPDRPAAERMPSPREETWGRYRLVARIGEGGFGRVYRAWDPELEREVAIKILLDRIEDPGRRETLLAEGRKLARVRHPHVVSLFGVETENDRVALCMEFVRGETLKEALVAKGPLNAREASLIGEDICRALAAVHAAGFVHGDVKAQNVMREIGGRIVLMDFSAAVAISLDLEMIARVKGTPLYLAPELFDGNPPSVRSDLYSLGVLLYYLVSGMFPVEGATFAEVAENHRRRRRQLLRDVRPDLPSAFLRAVDQATAERAEDRVESAGALQALLEQVVSGAAADAAGSRASGGSSVAVLPFIDDSQDRSLEYFCDGIAEELRNALGSVPGLRVAARGSSMQFRGGTEDARQIGATLNVATVLEGSVRAVGDQLRVVSRLVDVRDGFQIWSERFDRRLSDVFAVQDDIAGAVVAVLRVHAAAGASAPQGRATTSHEFDAYTLYLKGRHHWNKRTETSLNRSLGYFQEAIDRDPLYAAAYAGLADAYCTLGLYGVCAPRTVMPQARSAAQQALDLQPSLAGAFATWACVTGVYDWSWAKAEHYYKRAIELKPADASAHHWYAINHLVVLKRFNEADRELRLAHDADPLSVPIVMSRGMLSYFAQRFQAARQAFGEGLDFEPNSATGRLFLGLTLVELGAFEDALRELMAALTLAANSPETIAALGYAHARAGQVDRAQASLGELQQMAGERYVSPSLFAQVYVGLGEVNAALNQLEQAFELRAADLAWLPVRPVFNALRSNERFTRLAEQLGQ